MEHFPVLPPDLRDVHHGEVVDGVAREGNEVIRQKVEGQSHNRLSSVVEEDLRPSRNRTHKAPADRRKCSNSRSRAIQRTERCSSTEKAAVGSVQILCVMLSCEHNSAG